MLQISDEELEKLKLKVNQWTNQIKENRKLSINVLDSLTIYTSLDVYLYYDGSDISCGEYTIEINKNINKKYSIQLNLIKQEIDNNYDLLESLILNSKETKSFRSYCNRIIKYIISYCNKHDIQPDLIFKMIENNL